MKYSDFLELNMDNFSFENDKSKRLLNGFIRQLKKDNILVYDRHNREWNVRDVYYGHMFIDYCANRKERKPEKIDYKKHVIYKTFVNPSSVKDTYCENYATATNIYSEKINTDTKDWYVDFIKKNIKADVENIGLMNFFFNDKKVDLDWFDYHNLNCRYQFNNLVNDIDYPNFGFGFKNNSSYIDEMILEPIEKTTYVEQNGLRKNIQHFGYRVYSKLKENNKKEGIVKVNIIEYRRNPYDESHAAYLVEKRHWDKWIKIKENDNVAIINFKNSPYFANKEYLKHWKKEAMNYLENDISDKLAKENKPKVVERER